MDAKDLMIGDWVMFPHGIDKIVDLPYIGGKGQCASFAASSTLFPVPIEQLKPIPVTQEVLEKNGFERVRDKLGRVFYSIADDYFDLTIDEITDSIWCIEYDNIEAQFPTCRNLVAHVHELQHALRLCGIDKTIEL